MIQSEDRANQWEPAKLWSLLEMLEVKALPFVTATDLMTQIWVYRNDPHVKGMAPEYRQHCITVLTALKEQLLALGASRPTMASVEKILALLNSEGWTIARMGESVLELRGRLFDDLGGEFLLSLSVDEKRMYDANALWGEQVSLQFPSLQDEIREAGKCLALARYTASAFHSLRCLEGAIVAMSRCLGIADPTKGHERNWTTMLGKIDRKSVV